MWFFEKGEGARSRLGLVQVSNIHVSNLVMWMHGCLQLVAVSYPTPKHRTVRKKALW